jgi:hypothetical protein
MSAKTLNFQFCQFLQAHLSELKEEISITSMHNTYFLQLATELHLYSTALEYYSAGYSLTNLTITLIQEFGLQANPIILAIQQVPQIKN